MGQTDDALDSGQNEDWQREQVHVGDAPENEGRMPEKKRETLSSAVLVEHSLYTSHRVVRTETHWVWFHEKAITEMSHIRP
jgi:hypothetical protein